MATKPKEPEALTKPDNGAQVILTADGFPAYPLQPIAEGEAAPAKAGSVIYLTEQCKTCGASPTVRQGAYSEADPNNMALVTCSVCSKVIERPM